MRLFYRYSALALALALIITLLVYTQLKQDLLVAWLIAINLVAFGTIAYDKFIAGTDHMRVPERMLLFLALIGGTPGTLVGMLVFRHKTSKQSFQLRFWLIVLLQIILVVAYLAVGRRLT
jgi:uncharacterized membrane protein YsdA (DUF1294 family)